MADTTILCSIILLSTTPPTHHPLRPLIGVLLLLIMALITRVHFLTTAEAEPTKRFRVVATATLLWESGSWHDTEEGFGLAARREGGGEGGGDAEEFHRRDGEGEFGVAFAAVVGCGVALYGDDAGRWVSGGAG